MAGTPNAACLSPTTTSYSTYIANCMNTADTVNMNNLITQTDFTELLTVQEALATDTLTKLRNINDNLDQGGANIESVNNTVKSISEEITNIENEIANKKNEIEAISQDFIESITTSPKEINTFGNIQDVALAAFFISFIILIFTLCLVQYSKPGGSLLIAFYTFLAMVILLMVIYAIIQQVA
jgi:hypothetical protein